MTLPLPMLGAGAATTAAGMAAAPMMTVMMVAQAAFTAGAVAGTAGVIGLIALRRYMKEQRRRDSFRDDMGSASASSGMGGAASDMST